MNERRGLISIRPGSRDFSQSDWERRTGWSIQRIVGGQSNPTYFVTYGPHRMVLRKQPDGPILRGAHAVDREFRVMSALHPAGIPVPRPILFHDGPELLGTPFYLMERVEGPRVPRRAHLPTQTRPERRALWMGLAGRNGGDACGSPRRDRTRRLRKAGKLLRAPDRALVTAMARKSERPDPRT